MIYYLPWILLMAVSVVASLSLLIWGFRSGQFSEQERARYLPLRDASTHEPVSRPHRLTKEVYVLLALIGSAGLIFVATLATAVMKRYGG